ncbi:hypothetical protein ABBQ38_014121 [Trebouxia sp. C0009 RCD-2024]
MVPPVDSTRLEDFFPVCCEGPMGLHTLARFTAGHSRIWKIQDPAEKLGWWSYNYKSTVPAYVSNLLEPQVSQTAAHAVVTAIAS